MELLRGIIYQSVEDCTQRIFFFAILCLFIVQFFTSLWIFFFLFSFRFLSTFNQMFRIKIEPMN